MKLPRRASSGREGAARDRRRDAAGRGKAARENAAGVRPPARPGGRLGGPDARASGRRRTGRKGPRQSRRRSSFTGRAAVLAVVVAALAIALAGPLRHLLSQRGQISSTQADVQQQREQLKQLQQQQAQWSDPNYIKAQAEQRLHYVMPGQVPYVSLAPSAPASASPSPGSVAVDAPWYAQLWSSIEGAGQQPRPTSTPAATPAPSAGASAAPGGRPTSKP